MGKHSLGFFKVLQARVHLLSGRRKSFARTFPILGSLLEAIRRYNLLLRPKHVRGNVPKKALTNIRACTRPLVTASLPDVINDSLNINEVATFFATPSAARALSPCNYQKFRRDATRHVAPSLTMRNRGYEGTKDSSSRCLNFAQGATKQIVWMVHVSTKKGVGWADRTGGSARN